MTIYANGWTFHLPREYAPDGRLFVWRESTYVRSVIENETRIDIGLVVEEPDGHVDRKAAVEVLHRGIPVRRGA